MRGGRESLVPRTGLNFHFSPDTSLPCWAPAMPFQKVRWENSLEGKDLAKAQATPGGRCHSGHLLENAIMASAPESHVHPPRREDGAGPTSRTR